MLLLLLLVTRPLSRDGGMAGDHGAPEGGQLPKVWTRGRRETESCQKVSGASAECDERCPGTSVHRRCRKDSRFCQSYRDKNLKGSCVRCSVDERGHREHDEGAQVPQWKSREPLCQNTLIRQYTFSLSKVTSGYKR